MTFGSIASEECVGVVFLCAHVAACSGSVKTPLPSSAKEKGGMIWGGNTSILEKTSIYLLFIYY